LAEEGAPEYLLAAMKGKRPAGLSGNSYWPIASPAGVRLSAFRIRRLLLAAEIGKPIGSDRPVAVPRSTEVNGSNAAILLKNSVARERAERMTRPNSR
jgi:hypothetical protein